MFCKPIAKTSASATTSTLAQLRGGAARSFSIAMQAKTCVCCSQRVCTKAMKNSARALSLNHGPADTQLEGVLANNKKWVADMTKRDPAYFARTGGPQKPQFLYIGCADSRVNPNRLMGLGPGEVFVHRNVGNQVPPTDLNALSSIEYAVTHLDVKDIVVTGHYDCGAVRAALKTQDLGTIENWLRCIRDVYRLHGAVLDQVPNDEDRVRLLVELNVIETCVNVYKTGAVQRKRMQTIKESGIPYPRIHALVFDPKVGILTKIPVNFEAKIGKMRHIYDLYDMVSATAEAKDAKALKAKKSQAQNTVWGKMYAKISGKISGMMK